MHVARSQQQMADCRTDGYGSYPLFWKPPLTKRPSNTSSYNQFRTLIPEIRAFFVISIFRFLKPKPCDQKATIRICFRLDLLEPVCIRSDPTLIYGSRFIGTSHECIRLAAAAQTHLHKLEGINCLTLSKNPSYLQIFRSPHPPLPHAYLGSGPRTSKNGFLRGTPE